MDLPCRSSRGSAEAFWGLAQAPVSGKLISLRVLNYGPAGVGEELTRDEFAKLARTKLQRDSLDIFAASDQVTPATVVLGEGERRLPAHLWALARDAAVGLTMRHVHGEATISRTAPVETTLAELAQYAPPGQVDVYTKTFAP